MKKPKIKGRKDGVYRVYWKSRRMRYFGLKSEPFLTRADAQAFIVSELKRLGPKEAWKTKIKFEK